MTTVTCKSNVNANLVSAREGYDRVAEAYQTWHWTEFWRRNEAPIVSAWLASLEPGRGLDGGCGSGPYRLAALAAGHTYIGIDLSTAMLHKHLGAHSSAEAHRALTVQADVRAVPLLAGSCDWVMTTRVLSHIADPESVLIELERVLKPGGDCLIVDVHPEHRYGYVSLPTESGVVAIETHKHQLSVLLELLDSPERLSITALREYRLDDLVWKPPRLTFTKLYKHPDEPIFYVMQLRKSRPAPTRT